MKTLTTTTMALSIVGMFGATLPAQAAVQQAVDHPHIQGTLLPVRGGHGGGHFHGSGHFHGGGHFGYFGHFGHFRGGFHHGWHGWRHGWRGYYGYPYYDYGYPYGYYYSAPYYEPYCGYVWTPFGSIYTCDYY